MKIIVTFFSTLCSIFCFAQEKTTDENHAKENATQRTFSLSPVQVVNEQLEAYNSQNIESFLDTYSEDVELYNFPNNLIGKGKDFMRKIYGDLFDKSPELHCQIVNRTILGNTIIDHEKVSGFRGNGKLEAVAVYKVEGGKIAKVYFIRK